MYFPNASLQALRTGSDRLEPEAKQIKPPDPDRYTTSRSAGPTVWTAERGREGEEGAAGGGVRPV